MTLLLVLALLACSSDFDDGGGSTDGSGTDGGGGDGGGGDGGGGWATTDGGGGDGGGGGDAGWSTEPAGDADLDGYTAAQGDCDDGDDTVHPGADDSVCDGQDDDCDDLVDEDFDRDSFEPNDDEGYALGEIADESDELMLAWLWPEGDEDRYLFYVEDGDWSWFDIELWLYDVPSGSDYAIELWMVEDADGDYVGLVASADEESDGGEELVNYGGSTGFDDSGWYEAVVRGEGSGDCGSPYTLQILAGSW